MALALLQLLCVCSVCSRQVFAQSMHIINSSSLAENSQWQPNKLDDSQLNEEVSQCTSPWTYGVNGTCKCGNIREDILQCHLARKSTLSLCNCVTLNREHGIMEAGKCIFMCESGTASLYHVLPSNANELEERICDPFNRTGTLCGRCKEGQYPLAYSFDMNCMECPDAKSNWWKFVLVAFLPLTIFFFFVLLFNLNVISSNFHGFVWYSQGIAIPALARVILITVRHRKNIQIGARIIFALYGVWNLDFFRSLDLGICLGTDVVQTLALDLAVGVYPLLLMLLSYFLIRLYDRKFKLLVILWKPFHVLFGHLRSGWDIRTSLIDSFATFIVLSNVKLLSVSFDLLAPVQVYQLNSTSQEPTHTWRLYYDSELPYFGERHLPYAILAITVLVLFLILPTVLLIFYPFRWFQKFLNLFPLRWYVIHTFMDSFYGSYKNGTQPGTRDCRWFASVYFISRFIMMFVIGGFTLNAMFFPLASIFLSLATLFVVLVSPFKHDANRYGTINVVFLLLLSLWYVSILGLILADESNSYMAFPITIVILVIGTLPHLYVSVVVIHWIYQHRRFGFELVTRICTWRQGYQLVD